MSVMELEKRFFELVGNATINDINVLFGPGKEDVNFVVGEEGMVKFISWLESDPKNIEKTKQRINIFHQENKS